MAPLSLRLPVQAGRRIPEIDELKGLAILLVVLYHAGGVLGWSNRLRGDLGVDIFVILSGLGLALGSPYPGFGPFLWRRLRRIMPTYWLILTLALVCNTHFLQLHYTVADIALHYLGIHAWFGDAFTMSISDSFWFITLILSLYLLYAALRRWLATPEKLLLAGGLIAVSVALIFFYTGQAGTFGHLALRVPGFFLGLLLGQLLSTGRLELTPGPALGLAGFVLVFVPYTQGIVFYSVAAGCSVMGLYALALRPTLVRAFPAGPRFLKFLGDHSLEIFLLHQLLIRDYNLYLHGRWFNIPVPTQTSLLVGILAGLAVTLLLSVELQRLFRRLLPA